MADRLEVYEAADGWRWRRVADNNRVLCSGEAHTREADAWRGAHRACPDLDPDWAASTMTVPAVDHSLAEAAQALLEARDGVDPDALEAARARLRERLAP